MVRSLEEFDRRERDRATDSRRRSLRRLSQLYSDGTRDVSPSRASARDDWDMDYRNPNFYSDMRQDRRSDYIRDGFGTHSRFDLDYRSGNGYGDQSYGRDSRRAGDPGYEFDRFDRSSRRARFEPPPPRVAYDVLSAPGSGYQSPIRSASAPRPGAARPMSPYGISGGGGRFTQPPPLPLPRSGSPYRGYEGYGAAGGGVYGPPPPPPPPPPHFARSLGASREDVEELADLLLRRKFMRAFEEFYSEDVVVSDNGLHERVGKRECRQFRNRFLESVLNWHDVAVRTVMVDGDTSVIEVLYDITFRSGRRVVQKQALVQTWREGRIVKEVSYHMV